MKFLNKWIDEEDDELGARLLGAKFFGIDDDEIVFSVVKARSSSLGRKATGEEKLVEYIKWEEWVTDQQGSAPTEMKNFR